MEKKKKILIACGIAAGVAAAVYGGGCWYYSSHFFPNTTAGGINIAGMTLEEAEKAVSVPASDVLTISERNNQSETIALDTIDYSIAADDKEVDKAKAQQKAYAWPSALFHGNDYEVRKTASYDKTKLETEIKSLKAFTSSDIVAPVNAKIEKSGDTYQIIKEDEGNTLDQDKTIQTIEDTMKDGTLTIDLDEKECYQEPEIRSDNEDLNNSLKILQQMSSVSITIDLGGGASEELSGEPLADLLELSADGNVTVNSDKLNAYVQSLADKYNTFNTKRQFTTSSGATIEVGDGGNDTYGYLMDNDATAQAVSDAILSKQTQTITAMWVQTALTRGAANGDIGSTYIEVCLATQHLWFYKDGNLVLDTGVVTGNPHVGQQTPEGVYRVWKKESPSVLRGYNLDGTKYESPVTYWMPFDWDGRGLHDANWWSASDFGHSYYTSTNWSHGCINLPPSVAATIYNSIDVNTPVIVYE